MYYLIYVSSATELLDDKELMELLEKSRRNNHRVGITGLLLYKSGNILQYLEGEEDKVEAVYESIRRDPRHKDIIRIQAGTTQRRMFEDWSMGFHNMDKDSDLPDYRRFIDDKLLFRRFENEHEQVLRFLKLFNKMNR